jgi:hypothetical protein
MGRIRYRRAASLAALGLCGLSLTGAAVAFPAAAQKGVAHPGVAHPLDLRPPMTALPAQESSAGFPSFLHRQPLAGHEQLQLPQLGGEGPQPRSRVEEFAQRVHREGLSAARLWENKSALISLGLNQKGKPGIWIIQKTH